jgi:hypothetical protein
MGCRAYPAWAKADFKGQPRFRTEHSRSFAPGIMHAESSLASAQTNASKPPRRRKLLRARFPFAILRHAREQDFYTPRFSLLLYLNLHSLPVSFDASGCA